MSRKKRRTPAQRAGTPSRRVTVAPDAYTQHAVVDDPLRPYLPDFRFGLDDDDFDSSDLGDEARSSIYTFVEAIGRCIALTLNAMYVHAVIRSRETPAPKEDDLRASVEQFGAEFMEGHCGPDDQERLSAIPEAASMWSAGVIGLMHYAQGDTVHAQMCISDVVDGVVELLASGIARSLEEHEPDSGTPFPAMGLSIPSRDDRTEGLQSPVEANQTKTRLRKVIDVIERSRAGEAVSDDEMGKAKHNSYVLLGDAAMSLSGIFSNASDGDLTAIP